MSRSTKEEALETRSRILDAAENIFHANGVTRTSLADVALAANVTRGAIYWHFKNKGDLFNAMCERVHLPMEAMIRKTADHSERDPLKLLRAAFLFAIREIVHNPHARKVFEVIFHKCELVDVDDPIWTRQHECFIGGMDNIERLLREACAMGQLPADLDTHLGAVSLHAMVDGLINNWLFSPQSFDLGGQVERFLDAGLDMMRNAASLRLPQAA
ncbi:TetR family transcriptional regulator [Actimicrobium antarcticum]|uniref:TetR family transcriptional regulator n=1 Tax=Actimicrobium antarcticum TaxID=1051899 RepID=A0ABP7TCD3_9BURK